MYTLVVCECEPIAIAGLRNLLTPGGEFEIVAAESSLEAGRRAIGELSPRLLLVDNIAAEDPALDELDNRWEKWRDPSHVRNYTVSEWRSHLESAGLRITDAELMRKQYLFALWTERMQMPTAERAKLEADMIAAPLEAQTHFEIEVADGHVISWSADFLIARAVKPAEG